MFDLFRMSSLASVLVVSVAISGCQVTDGRVRARINVLFLELEVEFGFTFGEPIGEIPIGQLKLGG